MPDPDNTPPDSNLGGDYARDTHREGFGDDNARDVERAGTGARRDNYGTDERPSTDIPADEERAIGKASE